MINWETLAKEIGAIGEDGREIGSSSFGKRAIEKLLGEGNLRDAVDYYVDRKPGAELVRSVLWHIHPWSAMKYCYNIYHSSQDIENRRSAVELLRVIADERALPWVKEFLQDPDIGIQNWGAGLLDQMMWSKLVDPEDAEDLIVCAEQHANEKVRETAAFIRSFLTQNE
jgi:hypothetical protein